MFNKELNGVLKHLTKLGYNICFISLYGSQNYNLQTEGSDLDYKAVHIPSLRELVDNSKPVSTTLEYEGGQIDLKDIRIFTDNICKMNPVYLETLYTEHNLVLNNYMKDIIDLKELLISEMSWLFCKGCYGQVLQKYHAFSHPYPSIKHKVDMYGYDPKQLHHIVRLSALMDSVIKTGKPQFLHSGGDRDRLIKYKSIGLDINKANSLKESYFNKTSEEFNKLSKGLLTTAKENVLKIGKDIIFNDIINKIILGK